MINIVSQRSENSTDLVLEYIDWLGGVFNRVNHEDRFQGATVEISDSHEKILLDYGDERILHVLIKIQAPFIPQIYILQDFILLTLYISQTVVFLS